MKQYIKFYKEAKGELPRIYCDMDGVICDFVLAAKTKSHMTPSISQ